MTSGRNGEGTDGTYGKGKTPEILCAGKEKILNGGEELGRGGVLLICCQKEIDELQSSQLEGIVKGRGEKKERRYDQHS